MAEELRADRLAGTVMAGMPGPNVGSWSGRPWPPPGPHWATSWSPQQIAHRLRIEYPDDDSMRVSHEAIYQALYIQGRGALRRELTACLRTGRALRAPRARRRGRGKEFVGPDIMISERPAEAEDRDTGKATSSSALAAPRSAHCRPDSRCCSTYPAWPNARLRVKNGLALAGHGAEAVRDAITSTITASLISFVVPDLGPRPEMAQHAQLRIDTALRTATPAVAARHREHQTARTSPKGLTSIGTVLATSLLSRPHSTADRGDSRLENPIEAFNELLLSHQRGRVATTP